MARWLLGCGLAVLAADLRTSAAAADRVERRAQRHTQAVTAENELQSLLELLNLMKAGKAKEASKYAVAQAQAQATTLLTRATSLEAQSFTWDAVDLMTDLAGDAQQEQPLIHSAVSEEMSATIPNLVQSAADMATQEENKIFSIKQQADELGRAIGETHGFMGSVTNAFVKAERRAEAQNRQVEKTDVKVVKQVESYAMKKLKSLQKAVSSGTKLVDKSGAGIIEALARSTERMLEKVRDADKSEDLVEKAEMDLVKLASKHDDNVATVESRMVDVEKLSDEGEEKLDESAELLDELSEEGATYIEDAGDKSEARLGVVEEMQEEMVKELEEELEAGLLDLAYGFEHGQMDAEDWVANLLGVHTDTLDTVISDTEGYQKEYETKVKANLESVADSLRASDVNTATVTNNVYQLTNRVQQSKQTSAMALNDMLSEGQSAIDAVEMRNSRQLEKEGEAFATADSAQRRESESLLMQQVDKYRDTIADVYSDSEKKVQDDMKRFAGQAQKTLGEVNRVNKIAIRHSQRTEQNADDLKNLGDYFNLEWRKVAEEEKEKQRTFSKDLFEMQAKQLRENVNVEKKVKGDAKDVLASVVKEYENVKKQIERIDDSSQEELKKKVGAAMEQLKTVAATDPEAAITRVNLLGQLIGQMETTKIPTSKSKIASGFQNAQEQVDGILPAVKGELENADKETETDFYKFKQAMKILKSDLKTQLEPVLKKEEEDLQKQSQGLEGSADEINLVTRRAVADADKIGDAMEQAWRSASGDLLNGKEALSRKLEEVRGVVSKKQGETTSEFQEWQSKLRESALSFDEKLEKTRAQLEAVGAGVVGKVTSSAQETDLKAKNQLSAYVTQSSYQMSNILDEVARKLVTINPSEVLDALAAAKAAAEKRQKDLEWELATEQHSVDEMSQARAAAGNEEEARIQSTFGNVDSHLQSHLSDAVNAGTAHIRAAGDEASSAAAHASDRVRGIFAGVGQMADGASAAIGQQFDDEQQAAHGVQDYTYAAAAAAAAASAQVKAAEGGVQDAANAADARFSDQMSEAGQAMANREAGEKAQADGVLSALQTAAQKEKDAIAQEEADQQSELDHIKNAAAAAAAKTDTAANAAHSKLDAFEHALQVAEESTDAIGQSTQPLADKIAQSLSQGDFDFHEALRAATIDRVGQIHGLQKELLAPLGTVDDALSVLIQVQGMMQDRNSEHTSRVMSAVHVLEERVEALKEFEQYQEVGAVDKIHAKLQNVSSLLDKLHGWRTNATTNVRQWRQDVQDELIDMGHEIDVADLELHEEDAQEQALLNMAVETLEKALNFDLDQLDATSKARITAIAKNAAKQIGELLADTSLSEEERNKKLNEIKLKMKQDALAVLNEVMGLGMQDSQSGRTVDAAMADVQNSVDRMGIINSAMNKSPSHAQQLKELASLITAAKQKLKDDGKMSLLEEPSGVRAYLAGADPAARRQAEQEASAFLEQDSVAESKASIAEDRALNADLDAVAARLHV